MEQPSGSERVLVVDREPRIGVLVSEALTPDGLDTAVATSWPEAMKRLRESEIDLLLLEAELLRDGGLERVEELDSLALPPEVVFTTSGDAAEQAVATLGDRKCLRKPLDSATLRQIARAVVENRDLARENRALRSLISRRDDVETLVAESSGMKKVLETVRQVANARASVLITGETGSGKGLVAQTIHQLSSRAEEPFVPLNCGALRNRFSKVSSSVIPRGRLPAPGPRSWACSRSLTAEHSFWTRSPK